MRLAFTLNSRTVECDVDPAVSLLEVLRTHLGITSAKKGCGEGECGACSVFVDGVLVNACIFPSISAAGTVVMTLEGLLEETSVLRESFERHDASQCGFCTPGFVMAAYDYLRSGGSAESESVRKGLDGNLCRCTGYQKIIDAVVDAAEEGR